MSSKSIVVISSRSGRGVTLIAAHHLLVAQDLGLKIAGVSIDDSNELRRWARPAGLLWFDGLADELPSDLDLLVFDVRFDAKSIEVLRPDLWLLVVDNENAERSAASLAPRLAGRVLWVRNFRHGNTLSDDKLDLDLGLDSTDVVLPRCNALRASSESRRAVWSTPLGSYSAGARAMRELAVEVFGHIGLLQPEDAPYERAERLASLAEREPLGAARLAAFFDKLEAARKAEAEAATPKPWMVEWARDMQDALAEAGVGRPGPVSR